MAKGHASILDLADIMPSSGDSGKTRKGVRFWLVLTSLIVSLFLAILENVLIMYGLMSAALVPLSGSFAKLTCSQIFSHCPMMLITLFLFATGSVIGGAAQNMNMLLAAQAIQEAGGGSIFALTQIILSDIVTLKKRGKYSGLFGFTCAIAGGIAPMVGGGLAKHMTWCWLFYLNIPIVGAAMFLVLLIMRLPTPPEMLAEKVKKINSAYILTPLVIGLVGLVAFGVYKAVWCLNPIDYLQPHNYMQIFLVIFIFTNYVYYLSVYYQACKDVSPIASGIDIFPITFTIAPISVIAGASVTATKHYRLQLWAGWALTIVGFGLLSTVRKNISHAMSIGFQILPGFGIRLVYYTTLFPMLAPLPIMLNAHTLFLSMYFHALAQVWGVTLGGTILQNGLEHKLPATFTSVFNTDAGVAYLIILQIPHLQEPLKDQVHATFVQSLAENWIMLLVLSGLGLAFTLLMKALPLHIDRDER
ncbi:MFS general substrate transporter [Obba rivulosa]|uniref:MFS general substrate transporter n=1 Tax=Obba rivulosa TaxID=1052685 RepID=A0A8E2DMH9_9APHY|nr:MFS general substrate transporter [Obba rivulosa]